MKLRFGNGRGHGSEGQSKPVFEPTKQESELIAKFGGVNKAPFNEFRKELADAGIPEERTSLVSRAIVESRQTQGGSQERRS